MLDFSKYTDMNIGRDVKKIYDDIKKSNVIITGAPGTGKTTLSKLLLMEDIKNKIKVLAVDEERELKNFTQVVKGDYMDLTKTKLPDKLSNDISVILPNDPVDVSPKDNIIKTNLEEILEIAANNQICKLYLSSNYTRILLENYTKKPILNIVGVQQDINSFDLVKSLFPFMLMFRISYCDMNTLKNKYNIDESYINEILRMPRGSCVLYKMKIGSMVLPPYMMDTLSAPYSR